MSALAKAYIDGVIQLLQRITEEEMPALRDAAKIMAEAIAQGKRIFAFGCTHSSLPIQDLVYRAGGLMLINPIFGPGIASLDVRPATMSSAIERLQGYAQALLDNNPIGAGDVLILVSVSGRNAVPVEMAQLARERGIKVIGVTSRVYTDAFASRHPSGKKMYEFADVVLDNKVDQGDAMLQA
ncbi:MAG: sugar isomerase domain-containing protein, partial [Anaerolineales bacterium]|nr:sugar isomerase domain-containing protein [Anaerolineales bacterium]